MPIERTKTTESISALTNKLLEIVFEAYLSVYFLNTKYVLLASWT
jgi:hypothetical protein